MADLSQYKELWAFLISMLPIVEIRGALPVALASGIPPLLAFPLTIIGNMIPVPFILLFIRPIFNWLKKREKVKGIIQKLEDKAFSKSDKIAKYNVIGLILFVGIPLPGTGAWTGALIAALLDMRLKIAIPAIFLGVLLASVIVGTISLGGLSFLSWMLG